MTSTSRAPALPPEQRREVIVAATLPLVLQHGPAVTTRQIAEAAGIGEGTIFRVFPDKDALLDAVVEKVLDPAPLEARLAAIDATLPLDERLAEAVAALQERAVNVWQVLATVGPGRHALPGRPGTDEGAPRKMTDLPALVALLRPDRASLRASPRETARRLRAVVVAASHPALMGDAPLTPHEIVALFLDGARKAPR